MMHCQDVKIFGDMSECMACGNVWDTNDPNPPNCLRPPIYCKVRHDPPNTYGDCFSACVATLLGGKPPHFFEDGYDSELAFNRLEKWLKPQGLVVCFNFFDGSTPLDEVLEYWGKINPEVPAILLGASANADHCVCIRGNQIIHDPSISRCGLVGPNSNGYWNLILFVKK